MYRKVNLFDKEYPKRLENIPDRPDVLYVKGILPEENMLTVGIIGARNCSDYGKRIAVELGKAMALYKIQVISGMARGIDGIVQRTVIQNGGNTFAVLGCGVDVCYPKENRDIYEEIEKSGGIISIYPLGYPPFSRNFPPRNRIISGLSDVLVVIEAGMKSGTMITVDMALEQGKEVYVFPGRVNDRLSEGCNYLISQGANIILSLREFVSELVEKYAIDTRNDEVTKQLAEKRNLPYDSRLKKEIAQCLENAPYILEDIYSEVWKRLGEQNGLTITEVMETLCEMQMEGSVKKENGRYFLLL